MTQTTERLAPHFSAQLAQTLSVRNHRLFVAGAVLAIAPLWFGQNLPMIDMPQHAAQITALREIWDGNETFTRLFQINGFTPYLLGYMLLYLGSLVLPVAVASQLLVSLSLIAVPLLTGSLLRAAGADQRWQWLAIPCSYGFAFYWGFLSFLVAVPFGLLFLIQGIHFANAPTLKRGVAVAVASVALFFCHIIVLGFASLMALGYIVGAHHRNLRALIVQALPYTAALPAIAVWMSVTSSSEAKIGNDPIVFGPFLVRITELFTQPAGWDSPAPLLCSLITGSILLLPWLMGSKLSRRPERLLPFALGLLTFMVAPHYVFSAAYFYQRLGVFLVPLWLLAWDPPDAEVRRPDWLVMPIVLFWLFMNTGRFAAFAKETEAFDRILAEMEPGRHVASLVYDKESPLFALPVYLHVPAWYQAKRAGVVDFNFAEFYSQMARFKPEVGPRITETTTWYPSFFDWNNDGGAKYDYFLVKASVDVSAQIFKDKHGAVELVARDEWWWLYRNVEKAAADAASPAR